MINHKMVTDQEESEKYLRIAQKHLLQDDHQTALHYLYRSQQSCPSKYVRDTISKIEQLIKVTEENDRYEIERKAREELESALHSFDPSENRFDHVEAQEKLKAVERINLCDDFYQILGVPRDATEQEMKSQYHKLALEFHPDKNSTPGSSEAFKKINRAFDTLKDPKRRKYYDLHGICLLPRRSTEEEDDMYRKYSQFEDDITRDLFNDFSAAERKHDDNDPISRTWQHDDKSVLFHFVPVILFCICIYYFSSYFMSGPVYSLSKDSQFTIERKTKDFYIRYFVKENFEKNFRSNSLRRIEVDVTRDYLDDLQKKCIRALLHQKDLIRSAQNLRDKELEMKAKDLKPPECTEIRALSKRIYDSKWNERI